MRTEEEIKAKIAYYEDMRLYVAYSFKTEIAELKSMLGEGKAKPSP